MNLEPWQWGLAFVAAACIGIAKTGVSGLGLVAVTIFANLLPAREASGLVLPMLICADLVAVKSYRAHTQWQHLGRLFPWTAGGVLIGWLAMGQIDDQQASMLIGVIVLAMVGLHLWRLRQGEAHPPESMVFAAFIGILAGFTTLVANAAGPLMALYLLAMQFPKMQWMGTAAVFFFLINLFKVPFMMQLGLIDGSSFVGNLVLFPAVIAGALFGRWLLPKINQKLFETLALWMSVLAGLKLLF